MCDYSLHNVAARSAKVGDKLVSKRFMNSATRGFAAVGEPNVSVCVPPGTELAFDTDIRYETVISFLPKKKLSERVARFRYVGNGDPHAHRDALEFPSGTTVLLTRLCEGQHATVLQLPAMPQAEHSREGAVSRAEAATEFLDSA